MNTSIIRIGSYALGISALACACLVVFHGLQDEGDSAEPKHLTENTRVHTEHRRQNAKTSDSSNADDYRRNQDEATIGSLSNNTSELVGPNTRTKHRPSGLTEGNKVAANQISLIERLGLSRNKSESNSGDGVDNPARVPNMEAAVKSNRIPYPASFAELPKEHSFTNTQIEKMDELANQFVEDIGGADQDPADPAYFDRWTESVPANDSNYKFWFGRVAYVQQQLLAARAQTTSTDSTAK